MSLATRCTACGTIFRVVQDQLRVSEGWVRCGRCAEVFDAREQLFDMEREAPPPWPPIAEPAALPPQPAEDDEADLQADLETYPGQAEFHAPAAPPMARPDTTWVLPPEPDEPLVHGDPDADAEHIDIHDDAPAAFQISQQPDAAGPDSQERREPYWSADATAPAVATVTPPALEPPEDARPDVLITERLAALAAQPTGSPSPAAPSSLAGGSTDAPAAPEPAFLRQAASAARWQRPRVRLALGLCALLLLALLALQMVWQFRNALQALYPQATPALQSFCAAAGCELQPWRRIDALTVESSSLTQAGSGNNYKLTILLRNKAGYPLAMPWVDLNLTDASGAAIARRMLKPADFNLSKASMAGQTEESLQLVFSTGKLKVSGYTVEIFHP